MSMDEQTQGMRPAVRELVSLGFAEMIKPVSDLLAQVDKVDATADALVSQARAARDRLITGLVTGTANIDDLTLLAALSAGGTGSDFRTAPILARLRSQAKAALHRDAYVAGMSLAPGIFDKLAKRAAVVVKAVAAAKLPADAWTEIDALRGDPAGYKVVLDGHAEVVKLHRAYGALRRIGWLPEPREAPAVWLAYKDPWPRPVKHNAFEHVVYTAADIRGLVDMGRNTEDIPAALALWHACRVGAEPGLYSASDAQARYEEWAAPTGVTATKPASATSTRRPRRAVFASAG